MSGINFFVGGALGTGATNKPVVPPAPAPEPAGQVTDNLTAYYDANDYTSGTWNDLSGLGNHLTLNGATQGGSGTSKYFNINGGSNSAYINSLVAAPGYFQGACTLEFLYKPYSFACDRVAAIWGSGNTVFTINTGASYVVPVAAGYTTSANYPATMSTSNWYHIICTLSADGSSGTIYFNGDGGTPYNNGPGPQTYPSSTPSDSGKRFFIGNYDSSNQGNFDIAQWRFYDAVLTSDQAAQQWTYWSAQGYSGLS